MESLGKVFSFSKQIFISCCTPHIIVGTSKDILDKDPVNKIDNDLNLDGTYSLVGSG